MIEFCGWVFKLEDIVRVSPIEPLHTNTHFTNPDFIFVINFGGDDQIGCSFKTEWEAKDARTKLLTKLNIEGV